MHGRGLPHGLTSKLCCVIIVYTVAAGHLLCLQRDDRNVPVIATDLLFLRHFKLIDWILRLCGFSQAFAGGNSTCSCKISSPLENILYRKQPHTILSLSIVCVCRTIFLVLLFSQYARNVHFPLPVYKAKKGWTSYRLQVFKMFPVSTQLHLHT